MGESVDRTAFPNGVSSGHDGCVAVSTMIWSTGKARACGVTQRDLSELSEEEMASGMSGREGGRVLVGIFGLAKLNCNSVLL